ncbi:hypothetical protein NL448_27445, partial [Klebsiella pneumoniae]|nr:hypothetical protein [Klebsiella pneumoniae]
LNCFFEKLTIVNTIKRVKYPNFDSFANDDMRKAKKFQILQKLCKLVPFFFFEISRQTRVGYKVKIFRRISI